MSYRLESGSISRLEVRDSRRKQISLVMSIVVSCSSFCERHVEKELSDTKARDQDALWSLEVDCSSRREKRLRGKKC